MPFTTVSAVTHKPGDAAAAAVIALGYLWLFPGGRSARSRTVWSIVALADIAVAGTQGRGGLVGAVLAAVVGIAYVRDRLTLVLGAVTVTALGLGVASLLSVQVSGTGTDASQQRMFSVSQLVENVSSIGNTQAPENLSGTETGREQLWSKVFAMQVADGQLIGGMGFGINLAAQVGVVSSPTNPLRSPHNSHLDILARMGLVGLGLWSALWVGWYLRVVISCRRLARRGLYARRNVAVLCLMTNTAFLVSAFFDPQFEGAQVAALVWTAFGIAVAVTSSRGWFGGLASAGPQRDAGVNPILTL